MKKTYIYLLFQFLIYNNIALLASQDPLDDDYVPKNFPALALIASLTQGVSSVHSSGLALMAGLNTDFVNDDDEIMTTCASNDVLTECASLNVSSDSYDSKDDDTSSNYHKSLTKVCVLPNKKGHYVYFGENDTIIDIRPREESQRKLIQLTQSVNDRIEEVEEETEKAQANAKKAEEDIQNLHHAKSREDAIARAKKAAHEAKKAEEREKQIIKSMPAYIDEKFKAISPKIKNYSTRKVLTEQEVTQHIQNGTRTINLKNMQDREAQLYANDLFHQTLLERIYPITTRNRYV